MHWIRCIITFLLFTCSLAVQSDPFYLVLHSDNSTLNGKTLYACHEGAAIEGLCLGKTLANTPASGSTQFQYNYTRSTPNSGVLTWELPGGDFTVSAGLQLSPDPSTNVAIALFYPDYSSLYVSWDSNNLLYIKSYYDDTTNPPGSGKVRKLKHWHMCYINYGGYYFNVLAWVYGNGPPQNPTCQKVDVQRVFKKSTSRRSRL